MLNLLSCGPLALLTVIAIGRPPGESPAAQLLGIMRTHLEARYYAPAGVDVARIMDDASRRLAIACEGRGDACPLETGLEAARAAIDELGDPHTFLTRAPSPSPAPSIATAGPVGPPPVARPGGPPAQPLPLGWVTRTVRGQDHIYVAWVDPDGPAGKAGVRRYDRVIAADGQTASTLNAATSMTRATIERQGRRFQVEVMPDPGRGGAAPVMVMIGDVALIQFPSGSGEDMAQAGHDLLARARDARARAVVLDLRDNGGGGLQCAGMAAGFTDYSAVMRDRDGEATKVSVLPDHVDMGPPDAQAEVLRLVRPTRWTGPVAVLVNENTASCAESMAIQIEQAGMGFVVGEPTYGVGNTTVRPAPLIAGWAIQMTTSYTEDVAGRRLPSRPSLAIELEDDPVAIARTGHDPVLEAALTRLKGGG